MFYCCTDAKAAVLSFFRSLVFGTVPEAISKLSLEGVGLKPIFFQDGEGKYILELMLPPAGPEIQDLIMS